MPDTIPDRSRRWLWPILGLGILVRLGHLALIDPRLPFHAGGLFLEMARQVAAAGFRLPATIPFYTAGGIPFAYPPLSFFLTGWLVYRLDLDPILVANLVPPLLAVLSLPLFYAVSGIAGLAPLERRAATLAFALLPVAFRSQIDAAGLAESAGTLALLLMIAALLRAADRPTGLRLVTVGLAAALCLVSAPGPAYATAPLLLLLLGALWRRARTGDTAISRSGLVAGWLLAPLVALLAAAPYWLPVVRRHGLELIAVSLVGQHRLLWPLIGLALPDIPLPENPISTWAAAFATPAPAWPLLAGLDRLLEIGVERLFTNIVAAPYPVLWNVLLILGGYVAWRSHRRWLLALFLALVWIPREGVWMAGPVVALLAGLALARTGAWLAVRRLLGGRPLFIAGWLVFLAYAGLNAMLTIQTETRIDRSQLADVVDAARWLADRPEAYPVVVVGLPEWMREWVPYLSRHTVLNVPQGAEWKPATRALIRALDRPLAYCPDVDCLRGTVAAYLGEESFILLAGRSWFDWLTGPCGRESQLTVWRQDASVVVGHLTARAPGEVCAGPGP